MKHDSNTYHHTKFCNIVASLKIKIGVWKRSTFGPCLTFDLRFNLEKTQNFPNQVHGVIRLGKTFNLMYVSIKSVDLHVKSISDPCWKIIRVPPVGKKWVKGQPFPIWSIDRSKCWYWLVEWKYALTFSNFDPFQGQKVKKVTFQCWVSMATTVAMVISQSGSLSHSTSFSIN